MSDYVVRFRGSPERAAEIVRGIADAVAGRPSGQYEEPARWVKYSVMIAALSDVKIDYIRKARRERGEDGVKWKELSPTTIARRRVGREEAKTGRIGHRNQIVKQEFKKYYRRYVLSLPKAEARRAAMRAAEQAATRIMGETKAETLSQREVEILRDTDLLLSSVSPGEIGGSPTGPTYRPPPGEAANFHKVQVVPEGITFVTNVVYADTHQKGLGHCPARPFIPDRPPAVWLDRWAGVAADAIAFVVSYVLQREAGRAR